MGLRCNPCPGRLDPRAVAPVSLLPVSLALSRPSRWVWWLPLALAGCAGAPEPTVVERDVPVAPPDWMLEPCPETPVSVATFADLIPALEVAEAERSECAGRMQDLREWVDDETTGEQE